MEEIKSISYLFNDLPLRVGCLPSSCSAPFSFTAGEAVRFLFAFFL